MAKSKKQTIKPVSFRLDPVLIARLKDLARKDHRSLSNLVSIALWSYVYQEDPGEITEVDFEDNGEENK